MCARAMANMGVGDLILIAPQGELGEEAKQGAAHAQEVLRSARVFISLAEFQASEGEGIRIALSGRDGKLKRPSGLDEVLSEFRALPDHPFHQADTPVYLMFGPEDDGLSNEEMELCHHVCRLPTFGEITSLNLSHAVLLTLYMVRAARPELATSSVPSESDGNTKFKPGPAYYPSDTIRRWLEALGFDLTSRRVTIEKTLNRVLLSHTPTPDELRIVDSVLQQTVRKLTEK